MLQFDRALPWKRFVVLPVAHRFDLFVCFSGGNSGEYDEESVKEERKTLHRERRAVKSHNNGIYERENGTVGGHFCERRVSSLLRAIGNAK